MCIARRDNKHDESSKFPWTVSGVQSFAFDYCNASFSLAMYMRKSNSWSWQLQSKQNTKTTRKQNPTFDSLYPILNIQNSILREHLHVKWSPSQCLDVDLHAGLLERIGELILGHFTQTDTLTGDVNTRETQLSNWRAKRSFSDADQPALVMGTSDGRSCQMLTLKTSPFVKLLIVFGRRSTGPGHVGERRYFAVNHLIISCDLPFSVMSKAQTAHFTHF